MQSWVRPELPTAPVGSSQAPTAAVDNSAPIKTRPASTYKSGKVVQTTGTTSVAGWLRNLDRKPWSLEIPYETGGAIRPIFPDLVIVRRTGDGFTVDILEPHDPSLGDNFEEAAGPARFAERHGALFGRIQLIRRQASLAGGARFARLEINREATIKHLLLIGSNPQLDDLFVKLAE